MTPTFPAEFFQPDELREMSGSKQPALIAKWLESCGTPHCAGLTFVQYASLAITRADSATAPASDRGNLS